MGVFFFPSFLLLKAHNLSHGVSLLQLADTYHWSRGVRMVLVSDICWRRISLLPSLFLFLFLRFVFVITVEWNCLE